jgi:hypothetical protein
MKLRALSRMIYRQNRKIRNLNVGHNKSKPRVHIAKIILFALNFSSDKKKTDIVTIDQT